jgi:hypothetical protein
VPARPPTPGFPPQTSRRAVSLAETRESAARNPDFEGSSTADQIARRSLVAACTLSRHADTYGRQGFQVGTVVLCLCAVGWGRGCAGGRPASSLRTAPDLSFPMIDRCIAAAAAEIYSSPSGAGRSSLARSRSSPCSSFASLTLTSYYHCYQK